MKKTFNFDERYFKTMRNHMKKGLISGRLYRFLLKNFPNSVPYKVTGLVNECLLSKCKANKKNFCLGINEETAIYRMTKHIPKKKLDSR